MTFQGHRDEHCKSHHGTSAPTALPPVLPASPAGGHVKSDTCEARQGQMGLLNLSARLCPRKGFGSQHRKMKRRLEHLSSEPGGLDRPLLWGLSPLSACHTITPFPASLPTKAPTDSADTLRVSVSLSHHRREDTKGAEGCHNPFITLLPLTTQWSIRAGEFTSLHKSIIARIRKLACDQKLAQNQKRILEPISQKPQKPPKIQQKVLIIK